jgi:biopolymer transport protein TolR
MLPQRWNDHDSKEILAEINVTPLVDICLVLVIIFMVTTALFLEPPFKVVLPPAHSSDTRGDGNIFVTIAADGSLAVNERRTDLGAFADIITYQILLSKSKRVVIRADQNTLSDKVLAVLAMIKDSGAHQISFGTDEVEK